MALMDSFGDDSVLGARMKAGVAGRLYGVPAWTLCTNEIRENLFMLLDTSILYTVYKRELYAQTRCVCE